MANTFPLVSVIVPTHNRPDFLEKTIQSILDQTYSNLEIIVVSNGFSESNKKTVQKFNDPRILYLEQENSGGPASPRNHGIKKAHGSYLAFCDDDDLWLPEKIEKQVAILEKQPEFGLCYTKMIRFNENKEWSNSNEEGPVTFTSLLYTNTAPISSVIVKKHLIDKSGGFSESRKVGDSEDYEFLLRHILSTKFYFLDEYLIKYWSGNNTTTAINYKNKIFGVIKYTKTLFNCHLLLCRQHKLSIFIFLAPCLFHLKNAIKTIAYISLSKFKLV